MFFLCCREWGAADDGLTLPPQKNSLAKRLKKKEKAQIVRL